MAYTSVREFKQRLTSEVGIEDDSALERDFLDPAARFVDARFGQAFPFPEFIDFADSAETLAESAVDAFTVNWEDVSEADGEQHTVPFADNSGASLDVSGRECLLAGSRLTWEVVSQSGGSMVLRPIRGLRSDLNRDRGGSLWGYRYSGLTYSSSGELHSFGSRYPEQADAFDLSRLPLHIGCPALVSTASLWAALWLYHLSQASYSPEQADVYKQTCIGMLGIEDETRRAGCRRGLAGPLKATPRRDSCRSKEQAVITIEHRSDISQRLTRMRARSRNLRPFWQSQVTTMRRLTSTTFTRLRSGGSFRGVRWARPSANKLRYARSPNVNVDTGEMRGSIRWQSSRIGLRATCPVRYARYRQAVAPFLFFSDADLQRIPRKLAEYLRS